MAQLELLDSSGRPRKKKRGVQVYTTGYSSRICREQKRMSLNKYAKQHALTNKKFLKIYASEIEFGNYF